MLTWLTNVPTATLPELNNAYNKNVRTMYINRYRSRTEATIDHIISAFTWLRLLVINGDTIENNRCDTSCKYVTAPIKRGVDVEEALQNAKDELTRAMGGHCSTVIMTYNSGTAAAATTRIKEWFTEQENWHELDIAAICTTTPNHKISMFKFESDIDAQTVYVIINNLDTPAVVYKIATAIMLDMKPFDEELTRALAEKWLAGDGTAINSILNAYYKEFRDNEAERKRTAAIEGMCKAMTVDKSQDFEHRIRSIQSSIDDLYNRIEEYTRQMNNVKGEYLLYTFENTDDKNTELIEFIKSCGDKLAHINFYENRLFLVYKTKLIYYEAPMLQRYYESTRDNVVNRAPDYVQQLLKDIFIDQKYDLLIESGAMLNIETGAIQFKDPCMLLNCGHRNLQGIPNPHHLYYNCWGDNQSNISRALLDRNFISAILTTFAAISGLNMSDTAVISKFINEEIPNFNTTPCLEDKETGEIITISDYERRFEDASVEANE